MLVSSSRSGLALLIRAPSCGPAGNHRPDLDHGAVRDGCVPGDQRAVDDHEHSFPVVPKLANEGQCPDGPATSTSRLGFRKQTFTPTLTIVALALEVGHDELFSDGDPPGEHH